MAYNGLADFVKELESRNELKRIKLFVDPELEISEVTDRVFKNGGKALLFENNGSDFPVLINMFGSEERMSLAVGRNDLEDAGSELQKIFNTLASGNRGILSGIRKLPGLRKILAIMPKKIKGRGTCQQVIYKDPDLSVLPIMKCWPYDAGPFITLPVVHTKNPLTGELNAGMYRMQLIDKNTTGMHWHRHKTGANHYREYKQLGRKMPVAVTLGGDPAYIYSATAPLPEGVDEYILAGFLRQKGVRMVRCLTQDLWVPEDVDFVIEGFVDPSEDLFREGPFGDHTGFYSLDDMYPRFHITAISRRNDAVYPSTIVGIPPQEDALIGLATERLFLYPLRMAIQPDIIDFHLPPQGVAHNLVIVKIDKKFPGQGKKVINGLFGAGQMMFSKFIIVVDNNVDLNDYMAVTRHVISNTNFSKDVIIHTGPLDVLDHSSDNFSFGGKMGIDATEKYPEENYSGSGESNRSGPGYDHTPALADIKGNGAIKGMNLELLKQDIPLVFIKVQKDLDWQSAACKLLNGNPGIIFLALDSGVDISDINVAAWQVLSNTDPARDITHAGDNIIIDATAKIHENDKFPRRWPNIVVSDKQTEQLIDAKWENLGLGSFIVSPSAKYRPMVFKGGAAVNE